MHGGGAGSKPRVKGSEEMQGEKATDVRYNTIDRAVTDMAGGTVKLRHLVYALVAFGAPLAVGVLAMSQLV
jgi:hypothetical protein